MYKIIVIGTSLSGKTTLIKSLRKISRYNISELDEKLTALNKGVFPKDIDYKHKILFPIIFSNLLKESSIIFFTNVWYFSERDLKKAHESGFKIVQLVASLDVLRDRNIERMKKGYEDMEKYLVDMVGYQKDIKRAGFVDKGIEANQPVDKVVKDLLSIVEINS